MTFGFGGGSARKIGRGLWYARTMHATVFAALAIGMLWSGGVALAQQPNFIGENGDWKAYTFKRDADTVCYMASTPTKAAGDYNSRGRVYALITNDPVQGVDNQLSIVTGYTFQKDSEVVVEIGGRRFALFTNEDKAWTRGPEDDTAIIAAMISGADMVVEGTSSRGTVTTDTYSLIGFTATKRVIDTTCAK
jgi:hypothetical protein